MAITPNGAISYVSPCYGGMVRYASPKCQSRDPDGVRVVGLDWGVFGLTFFGETVAECEYAANSRLGKIC